MKNEDTLLIVLIAALAGGFYYFKSKATTTTAVASAGVPVPVAQPIGLTPAQAINTGVGGVESLLLGDANNALTSWLTGIGNNSGSTNSNSGVDVTAYGDSTAYASA